jgi:hypothetical protein
MPVADQRVRHRHVLRRAAQRATSADTPESRQYPQVSGFELERQCQRLSQHDCDHPTGYGCGGDQAQARFAGPRGAGRTTVNASGSG